jgi:glycosyltransferase involved in cell wall biosynthesis
MKIYIPTYGRQYDQRTIDYLSQGTLNNTEFVVSAHEAPTFAKNGWPHVICPVQGQGIHLVRQWILDNASERYICMIDDDLAFYTRKTEDAWNLRYCTKGEVEMVIHRMASRLKDDGETCVGISSRQGNNNFFPATELDNTRLCHIYAFDTQVVKGLGFRFDEMELMEDYHLFLTLLKNGYPNRLICDFAVGQPSSNTKGGCSTHRTPALQEASAKKLAELHKPFVKVVEKTNKSGWDGMKTRTDVIVSWKKAYEHGRNKCTF